MGRGKVNQESDLERLTRLSILDMEAKPTRILLVAQCGDYDALIETVRNACLAEEGITIHFNGEIFYTSPSVASMIAACCDDPDGARASVRNFMQ